MDAAEEAADAQALAMLNHDVLANTMLIATGSEKIHNQCMHTVQTSPW